MLLKEFEEKMENNSMQEAKKMIEEIGCQKNTDAVPLLIHYLVITDDNNIRNAIAIALSDIGSTEAIEPIISMLRHPKTIGARGTLLYALESFDCSNHVELITELLFDDTFEVSRQSFLLLESNINKIPIGMRRKCIERIQDKIKCMNDKIEFLSESLKRLTDKSLDLGSEL